MSTPRARAVRRVIKLQAIARRESTPVAEARTARLHAKRIIAKHKLRDGEVINKPDKGPGMRTPPPRPTQHPASADDIVQLIWTIFHPQ